MLDALSPFRGPTSQAGKSMTAGTRTNRKIGDLDSGKEHHHAQTDGPNRPYPKALRESVFVRICSTQRALARFVAVHAVYLSSNF